MCFGTQNDSGPHEVKRGGGASSMFLDALVFYFLSTKSGWNVEAKGDPLPPLDWSMPTATKFQAEQADERGRSGTD